MGNGNKAALAREKNLKDAKKGPTSQLKANVAAMTIQCVTCKQTFMQTVKGAALEEHSLNKHKKALLECFPGFVERVGKGGA